jgi:hypothetical protein
LFVFQLKGEKTIGRGEEKVEIGVMKVGGDRKVGGNDFPV